jgi:hypothetical protein
MRHPTNGTSSSERRPVGRPAGFPYTEMEKNMAIERLLRWQNPAVPLEVKRFELRAETFRQRLVRNYIRADCRWSCFYCFQIRNVDSGRWKRHLATKTHLAIESAYLDGSLKWFCYCLKY